MCFNIFLSSLFFVFDIRLLLIPGVVIVILSLGTVTMLLVLCAAVQESLGNKKPGI